jgi:hypothetical protein
MTTISNNKIIIQCLDDNIGSLFGRIKFCLKADVRRSFNSRHSCGNNQVKIAIRDYKLFLNKKYDFNDGYN